jgi:hypothetical protein
VQVRLDEFQEDRKREETDSGTNEEVQGCCDYDPPTIVHHRGCDPAFRSFAVPNLNGPG